MPRTAHYRSHALSRAQVLQAIQAHEHAEALGKPLNLFFHVHWQWTVFANRNRRTALTKLLEGQRHWLAQRKEAFYSIAIRENPPSTNLGEHAHQLIHIPPPLHSEFISYVKGFLRGNKRHQRKALKITLGYSRGKLAYLCKGATEPGRSALLDWFESDYEREKFKLVTTGKHRQGVINGKRLIISHSLCTQARQAARSVPIASVSTGEIQSPRLFGGAVAA